MGLATTTAADRDDRPVQETLQPPGQPVRHAVRAIFRPRAEANAVGRGLEDYRVI